MSDRNYNSHNQSLNKNLSRRSRRAANAKQGARTMKRRVSEGKRPAFVPSLDLSDLEVS